MKSLTIIGTGISGLTLAQCLNEKVKVSLLEKDEKAGGLIGCKIVNECVFHRVGGHVFSTKNQKVHDWFFSFFDLEAEFIFAKRNAKILLNGNLIGYPIENFLYDLGEEISSKIIGELILTRSNRGEVNYSKNFEDYLRSNFGDTLYTLYFEPYNSKIWKTKLSEIPMEWLKEKLPMPSLQDILIANINKREESNMVHSTFYYPKENGSQFIVDRLSEGLSISYKTPLVRVEKCKDHFLLNHSIKSKFVVYTGDVRKLGSLIHTPSKELYNALKDVKNLPSNGTSNLFCECDDNDLSWLYLPDSSVKAHRIIFTGNFSSANNRGSSRKTCVVEFSGYVELEVMKKEIKKLPGNLFPLDHYYEPLSYVIQNEDTKEKINTLKKLLEPSGLFLLGRFAEWEYYNMDKAIEAALALSNLNCFQNEKTL